MKILVLGHNGLLGNANYKFFRSLNYNVHTCNEWFPSDAFKYEVQQFNGDYIINCIGAISQKTANFSVNIELPIWLDKNAKCRVIHPTSDLHALNDYGFSKYESFKYLLKWGQRTKIIRTSIIGFEIGTKYSLLEWFLSQDKKVEGYTKAIWNGITTLEWAFQAGSMMMNWDSMNTSVTVGTDKISKYELLKLFNKLFNKNIEIIPIDKGEDRSLDLDIKLPSIEQQLKQLKVFYGRET